MRVHNVHERTVSGDARALIDSLASEHDALWPTNRWPAMRLDRPLGVGAKGGHGPIRYEVVGYEPGRLARFRFTGMPGFEGEHGFEALPVGGDATLLRHTATAELRGTATLKWRLAIRRLHDALVEDAFDKAAKAPQRRHSWAVRATRAVIGRILA